MRLIDADELLKPVGCYNPIKYTHEYGEVVKVEDITQMPTVEAEPIRHGHWEKSKDDNDRWRCSYCGHVYIGFNGIDSTFAEICYYCPHCGAKMDGVEE